MSTCPATESRPVPERASLHPSSSALKLRARRSFLTHKLNSTRAISDWNADSLALTILFTAQDWVRCFPKLPTISKARYVSIQGWATQHVVKTVYGLILWQLILPFVECALWFREDMGKVEGCGKFYTWIGFWGGRQVN